MMSDSLFLAEKGGFHSMVEELKCSLICTFSGEGRRPANGFRGSWFTMHCCKRSCQITEERLQLTLKSQSSVVHANESLLSGAINFTVDIQSFTSDVAIDR